jgi:hypothetical protein
VNDPESRLAHIFDRLARLRDDELAPMTAREDRPAGERRRAREAARAAIADVRRTDLAIAEEMLRAWATSVETAVPTGIWGTTGTVSQLDARQRALPMVADAVLAALAWDALDPEDREVLTDSVIAQEVGLG